MAVYNNTNKASPLTTVEFTAVPDGNFTFFHASSPEKKDDLKQWLTSKEVGQEIVAETLVNGKPVFITHGDKTQDDMMKLLEARGDKLDLFTYKPPFSKRAWKTGASIAFVGQGLQLASSFLRPNRKIDWSLMGLAVPNLIATTIILLFGAQRTPDVHKLRTIKTDVNEALDDYMPDPSLLPSVDDKRAPLRTEPEPPRTIGNKAHDFLKRYSVVFAEIGLRYLGAFALAFPANKWGKAWKELRTGNFKIDAFKAAYHTGKSDSKLMVKAGLLSLAGKTVALASIAPDPYNPKPLTWLDRVRQNITFRFGGIMETVAFSLVAVDAFSNPKKTISFKQIRGKDQKLGEFLPGFSAKNEHTDFLSGIGGAMFTIRYIIRYWAPFGVKEMDMKEMYAHVTDALAQIPPDKLAQAMAESAAEITQHFKGEHLEYNQVFTKLKGQLYHDHNIALDNLGTEPEERLAKMNGQTSAAPQLETKTSFAEANPPRKRTETAMPATSYVKSVETDKAGFAASKA